ncbi:hypothetical protein NLG97_g5511 [Lecanicillium saksenae]|uniref:Uncharacterized protein n=1 Tax=Lecanicillium saksenae TaxID=468837 RepID=A0ACC1QTY4_9HYPO|nr:hypothetical protein NLG97_g5511 [Lecanicillium saksenae]
MSELNLPLYDGSCGKIYTATQQPTTSHTESTSPSNHRTRIRLEKLPPEVGRLIFSHLRDVDTRAAHLCRLVCHLLAAWATPALYHSLQVTAKLLDLFDQHSSPAIVPIISTHTRHLIIHSNLERELLQRLLSIVRGLASLRWCYVSDSRDHGDLWPPPQVLQYVQPGTALHLDGLPLRTTKETISIEKVETIPAKSLETLLITHSLRPLATCRALLKRMLLRATNLQTFDYQVYGCSAAFEFCGEEKLPPIKNLLLGSYSWNHAAEDVQRHWEFSRIETLRLTSVPIRAFLTSVSMDDFANLHTLQVEDRDVYLDKAEADKITDILARFIGDHIRGLTHLDITCNVRRLPVEAITRHRHSLQYLRIRDNIGFEEDGDMICPTLSTSDIAVLADGLRHLQMLELDVDTAMCDPVEFIQAIAGFRKLRELTVHTRSVATSTTRTSLSHHLPAHPDDQSRGDGEATAAPHDSALYTAVGLLRSILDRQNKIAGLEQGELPGPLLKRVTINMRGWRPVILRRVAAARKRRNRHGIYAERCFVFERQDFQTYFSVTEFMAKEPSVAAVRPPVASLDHLLEATMMTGVC